MENEEMNKPQFDEEALYKEAKSICYERKCASSSYLQRRMKIGYNKASLLVDRMEKDGIIGPAQGSKPRVIIDYTK
jgi:DNA segregation ATPase FtsK/SpoIIIE and related proteins